MYKVKINGVRRRETLGTSPVGGFGFTVQESNSVNKGQDESCE